ncbi:MAG: hypothetical protein I3274_05880 [Candidatus Moeniiplasma glomeromycotorum]|nr:hypothetical protein [Candidatus Moeniiplasma glomeromycotorum]
MVKAKKRLVIDSGQFEKFDNKLLEIAKNILTERDIRVRRHWWAERLIVYTGWDGWNYEKSFLPQDFDEYDRIVKEVKSKVWLEEKNKDGSNKEGYPKYPDLEGKTSIGNQWGTYEVKRGGKNFTRKYFLYNCYLLRNHNHIIQFVFQNEHQADFSRPDIVIFFRGSLFWVIDYDVIDSRMLYIHVTCKRDVTWIYHKQIMSRPGTANIVRSQLTRFRPARKDPHDKNSEVLKNEKGGVVIDYTNPFPDHCFSFCSDLRCEKISSPISEIETFGSSHLGRAVGAEWQPEFGVCFADPSTFGVIRGDADKNIKIMGKDNEVLASFPSSMKLRQFKGDGMSIFPMILFLVDRKHWEKTKDKTTNVPMGAGGMTAYPSFPSTEGDLSGDREKSGKHFTSYATAFTAWLPNVFNEQPHLIYHSNAQFYFLRKLVTTVELKRLKITYKGAKNWESGFGNDIKKGEIHCIKYRIRIMSSVAGITYHFESGDIFFRWELQVQQVIQAQKMWETLMQSWALNVSNFLSGMGLDTSTLWGNLAQTAVKNLLDKTQRAFKRALKEKINREAKKWAKNARSRIFLEGVGTGGSVLGIADFVMGFAADLFSDEPEAEERTLDVKQTIIKRDTLKGQLGLYDSKEVPNEEQNTARMKTSNETGRLSVGETTSQDRDFGGMKKGFDAEKEQSETIHKSVKQTTTKGAETFSLGKTSSLAHYYVNTIKMKYDVYEFFNRSIANPFEIRFDYSDQLYNSLENCNHASPAQSFDRVAFSNLQQLVRRGEIQADINIDFDFNNEYKNAFARGIFFRKWEDYAENFPVWWPKRAEHASGAIGSIPNAIPLDSQEEVKPRDVWRDVPFEDSQGGPDNTAATRCGAWIIKSGSYIRDESGKDWFKDFESQVPSATRFTNWDSSSKWSFRTTKAGGSSGSASVTIPNLKCSYLLTTYDGRNNVEKGRGDDITLHGATLVWTARSDSVDFELKVNGTKRIKETITELVTKEIPPDVFMPEIPIEINIPGSGGSEETPDMEEFVEKIIEGMDELSDANEFSMDGLMMDLEDESANQAELDMHREEADEISEDLALDASEEDEDQAEKAKEAEAQKQAEKDAEDSRTAEDENAKDNADEEEASS